MVRRVCLDSDVIIDLLSNIPQAKEAVSKLDANFFITSINLFEIWYGRKSTETIDDLLSSLHCIQMDEKAAKLAGDLLRELKKKGEMMDMRDLFIGAICMANNIELLTFNKKHFEKLRKHGLLMV